MTALQLLLGTDSSAPARDLHCAESLEGLQGRVSGLHACGITPRSPLFQKSGRTIKPTDEAIVLMSKVQQSFIGLDEIAGFSEQLRKQPTGRFSVRTVSSIGHSVMLEIIDHLCSRFPDVMISLSVASYL